MRNGMLALALAWSAGAGEDWTPSAPRCTGVHRDPELYLCL